MSNAEPLLSPALVVVCVIMAITAGLVCRFALGTSPWTVPVAGVRAAIQLAGVALVLAAAMMRLWSSLMVVAVMFVVASATAARRSQADHGSPWLATALAAGMAAVIPLLLVSDDRADRHRFRSASDDAAQVYAPSRYRRICQSRTAITAGPLRHWMPISRLMLASNVTGE